MRSHLGKWKMLMVGCQACELIVTREHAGMMFLGYDYLVGCQACTLIKPRVRDLGGKYPDGFYFFLSNKPMMHSSISVNALFGQVLDNFCVSRNAAHLS